MVTPIRELANTLSLFTSNLHNNKQEHFATWPIDININTPKDHSNTTSFNNFREFSPYSDVSSIDYTDRVYILANNLS